MDTISGDIVNQTVTATTGDANSINATVFSNEQSVEITGLVKQARYEVTVTVCTNTCCHETKPVTLSESTGCM